MSRYYFGHREAHMEELYSASMLGIDTETLSVENKTLLGVGISLNHLESYFFTGEDIPWDLIESSIPKVLANYRFDKATIEQAGHSLGGFIQDSSLAAHALGYSANLHDCYLEIAGKWMPSVNSWFEEHRIPKKQRTCDVIPEAELADMCCQHAIATLYIWNTIHDKIPWKAYNLEMKVTPILDKIESRCLYIDKDEVRSSGQKLQQEIKVCRDLCKALNINVLSSQQLSRALLHRGYNLPRDRDTGSYLTDRVTLLQVCPNDPLAQLCMSLRPLSKGHSTYIKPYLDKEKVFVSFNQLGTDTGRFSVSRPKKLDGKPDENYILQNVPEKYRGIYVPSPGKYYESWDLSQVELRTLAYMSQDPRMLEVYRYPPDDPRGDIHAATMSSIRCERRPAKVVNFGVSYGATEYALVAEGLKVGFPLTREEATEFMKRYFEQYLGVKQYIDDTRKFARCNGYVETLYGRRKAITYTGDRRNDWHMDNQAINMPIQGTAAEIMKEMLCYLKDLYIVLSVHDDTTFERDSSTVVPEPIDFAPFATPVTRKIGLNLRDLKEI